MGHKFLCKTIPINKVPLDSNGYIEPKCNSCNNNNCGNPIKTVDISIFGVIKKTKVFMSNSNTTPSFVISCDGYMDKEFYDDYESENSMKDIDNEEDKLEQ